MLDIDVFIFADDDACDPRCRIDRPLCRKEARDLQNRVIPVNTAITSGWGVPALKAAMDFLGLYGGPVRPPLLPVSSDILTKLKDILRRGGIERLSDTN